MCIVLIAVAVESAQVNKIKSVEVLLSLSIRPSLSLSLVLCSHTEMWGVVMGIQKAAVDMASERRRVWAFDVAAVVSEIPQSQS